VVEIGTAQGGTLGALCEIAADDALVVSIDLPGGDKDEVSEDDKYGKRDIAKMVGYAKPGQRVEFLQADSHRSSTRATLEHILEGRLIDLLFIDGDHSYQGVKADFELYLPLVAPTGLIGLHDIATHIVQGVEVDRFWAELKTRFNVRECIYPKENRSWGSWAGIGIVDLEEQ
jgi:23S rRNA U2552 (ribose-2'-O)-methylase RlmE/FtsJ